MIKKKRTDLLQSKIGTFSLSGWGIILK